MADKTKMLELFELGQPDDGDDDDRGEGGSAAHPTTEDREVRHGPPRVIDIPAPNLPGGSIQISSSTMDPEFMKKERDEVMKLMQ